MHLLVIRTARVAEPARGGIYHYGVDLPAATGAAVIAAAAGTVIRVQRNGPGGLEMLVQHDGFVGVYSHFGSIAPAFAEGKREVAAGERLGVVGMTGVTSGPHLYFEMIVAGRPVDPAPYLGLATCSGAAAQRAAPAAPGDGSVVIDGKKYLAVLAPGTAVYPVAAALPAMSETLLDMKGTACPIPVLRANRALRSMAPGERLRVLATDRASVADFQAFCRETGHALLAWSEENGVFSFVIRRRAEDPEQKD